MKNNAMNQGSTLSKRIKYARYLNPADVWAMAFGCIVGWGAFVMPGTTFLPLAGPFASVLAILTGMAIMLVIGKNYSYLMRKKPGTGGAYSYTKEAFGRDHAFVCTWFLSLSYLTIVFLNATALFVMSRTVSGDMLQKGFHYQVAGYDIYLGELVLSALALAIIGLLFIGGKPLLQIMQTILAALLFAGVIFLAVVCIPHIDPSLLFSGFNNESFDPTVGFITIVLLAPWAFVGFDTASLETAHFKFPVKRSGIIITLAIIFGGITYAALTIISLTDVPRQFSNWQDYISNLDKLKGISSIPPFLASESTLGQSGVIIISIISLAAIFTGIIGAYRATARILSTMAQDHILSKRFLETPFNILFIMIISILISFLGRNALVWFVDITSFGAIVGFGYTSAASWKKAKLHNNKKIIISGITGTIISAVFLFVHLVSKIGAVETMGAESFLLLSLWCLLGFVFYWRTMSRIGISEFGGNTITSTVLFCLLLYSSIMWFIKSILDLKDPDTMREEIIIRSVVLILIIASGLAVMLYIQSMLQKRQAMLLRDKIHAEESSKAKSRFLFNISHDIRTPMNAIIGYTHLISEEENIPENIRDYVDKIDISGKHLLTLINDVLEMSLIESGKLELNNEDADIVDTVNTSYEMFRQQMEEKKISYTVSIIDVTDHYLVFDRTRFMRIILNLLSNAYKFTAKGGRVSMILKQLSADENIAFFELSVKDNGIGMTKEFSRTVFDAFERERTSTVSRIQGTGLGMAITKSIVDAMGGKISVNTAPGKGTEFIISFSMSISRNSAPDRQNEPQNADTPDFISKHLLLVEDIEINRQLSEMLLRRLGFNVESAENGLDAVQKLEASEKGHYDAILMDIQMPVMNGYEATEKIRALGDPEKADIPIIAVTANAFGEDIRKAHDHGMNAHIAKPIDPENLRKVLTDLLQ